MFRGGKVKVKTVVSHFGEEKKKNILRIKVKKRRQQGLNIIYIVVLVSYCVYSCNQSDGCWFTSEVNDAMILPYSRIRIFLWVRIALHRVAKLSVSLCLSLSLIFCPTYDLAANTTFKSSGRPSLHAGNDTTD